VRNEDLESPNAEVLPLHLTSWWWHPNNFILDASQVRYLYGQLWYRERVSTDSERQQGCGFRFLPYQVPDSRIDGYSKGNFPQLFCQKKHSLKKGEIGDIVTLNQCSSSLEVPFDSDDSLDRIIGNRQVELARSSGAPRNHGTAITVADTN
jgi:hypothetical protein